MERVLILIEINKWLMIDKIRKRKVNNDNGIQ